MVSPSENGDDGAGEISKRGRDTVQTHQKVRCESRHSSTWLGPFNNSL